MGLERAFGSLETGKVADLAIIYGDPLTDFKVLGKPVEALFMDGKMVINNCRLKVVSKKNDANY
jgi:imidazolonepropionase-like amidohydrolase